MKFRSKPTVADLVPFDSHRIAALTEEYPGIVLIHHPDGSTAVYNELHQSEINLEDGDFLNVTHIRDVYPIKAAIVAERYEPVEEPES